MQHTQPPQEQSRVLPIAVLLVNALIWGLSWWPLKALQEEGWHPLWCTTLVFLLGTVAIAVAKPGAVAGVCRSPLLLVLGLAAGLTNGAFNWGVAVGDVVRVILLFYLMPIWAAIMARVLLKEKITTLVVVRIVLALTGAAIVLSPEGGGIPLPSNTGDWLGLFGGMAFALTNVMLRRAAHCERDSRALAMFAGSALVPGVFAALIATKGIDASTSFGPQVWGLVMALGSAMLVANYALQFAAARLPVNTTSVVLLTEVVFAVVSSVLLIGAVITPSMMAGGLLIVVSSVLSALPNKNSAKSAG
ncbi:DMT family transporter [Lacisediminimonas sp.]|uniref:DMT family transporter n=1 Tax=Lacisediminimonas sp. TaxID=3060582 RepID=UPI00271C91A9|nr:DMT family transporter [Lacisediminimonas sp.]MDO8298553.1 DMT family transporter [Lacisediminimonas sp.]